MWLGAVGSYPLGGEWLMYFFFKVDGPITSGGGGGGGAYKQNF